MTTRARLALVAPLILALAPGCEDVVAEPPFDGAVDAEEAGPEEAGPADAFAPPDVQEPDFGLVE